MKWTHASQPYRSVPDYSGGRAAISEAHAPYVNLHIQILFIIPPVRLSWEARPHDESAVIAWLLQQVG